MIKGELKANAIDVTTYKVVLSENPSIIAKFVVVNTETGITHAVVEELNQGCWSDKTLIQAQELADLIEADLAKLHLKSSNQAQKGESFPEGGLGEHLMGNDVTSV